MKSKKYVFISLNIRNGETEYYSNSVDAVGTKTNFEKFANKTAKNAFGGTSEFDEATKTYFFFNDTIAASVNDFREITKEEFKTVSTLFIGD